ncbi:MAG TPA: TraR/DksA C4-type zinc finger protein [Saprospiraceae bacterium]|nr:TraR/DksA C4-type zinc finger protein [Saprospiraceae bacterium]
MTEEDKKLISERITKMIRRNKKKIASMEDMSKPISPENSIGRLSRMDAINNKSVMEAALRTAKTEMENLLWAKKHLDDPDYGQCISCEKKIQLKRLILMPGSRRCISCA